MALKDRRFMGVTWCPSQQQYEARIWTRSALLPHEHVMISPLNAVSCCIYFISNSSSRTKLASGQSLPHSMVTMA